MEERTPVVEGYVSQRDFFKSPNPDPEGLAKIEIEPRLLVSGSSCWSNHENQPGLPRSSIVVHMNALQLDTNVFLVLELL